MPLLSLQESMRKKPLTQISFAFEDLGAAPEEISEQLIAPSPTEVKSVETIVQSPDSSPAVGVRSIRKKEAKPSIGKRGRKSMRELANRSNQIQVPPDEELFKKQYYTIGEVAKMFQENQSLIRYWESEFDILQPKKNKK